MKSQRVQKTFLFTDLQQSSFLWEQYRSQMENALHEHDKIITEQIEKNSGTLVKMMGDGAMAVFDDPMDAVRVGVGIQTAMAQHNWGVLDELKVRIGIHSGEAQERDGDYFGPSLSRAARIMSAGHGGQILVSSATKELIDPFSGSDIDTSDLGEYKLRGLSDPERIYQIKAAKLDQNFPPLNTQSNMFKNFPQNLDTFYARELEITQGIERLRSSECQLLTIAGAGGSGKTRLSIEIAENLFTEFSHGALFVPLSHQEDHQKIYVEIGDALQFSFYGTRLPEEQIIEYLTNKEMLIVLDNFEHLVDGVPLLSSILDRCTKLKFIVSSRQLLNINREWVLRIGGLPLSDQQQPNVIEHEPAIALFIAKAKKIDADFSLTEENAPHVIKICQLVDGIPLGIELAAAWISVLSCEEIANEIKRNLDFLESETADGINQYQSLRGVFESSWHLLGETERSLLRKLSIFIGEFNRTSSEDICMATLSQIRDLVDKSLVLREHTDFFRLQELLRQFGREKLNQDSQAYQEIVKRYCEYYAHLLTSGEEQIKRRDPQVWEPWLLESKNIFYAWDLAIRENDIEFLDHSAIPFFYFLYHRSNNYEALELFDNTIQNIDSELIGQKFTVLAKLKILRAFYVFRLGRVDEAKLDVQSALHALDERVEPYLVGLAYQFLGNFEEKLSNYDEAIAHLHKSIEIRKMNSDQFGLANSLNSLGSIQVNKGNVAEAKTHFEESLSIRQAISDHAGISVALNNLGIIAFREGNFDEARRLYHESVVLNRKYHNIWYLATSLSNLGLAEAEQGSFEVAQQLHKESFDLHFEIGDQDGMARSWTNMALVSERADQPDIAINMLNRSIEIRTQLGDRWGLAYSLTQLGRIYLKQQNFDQARTAYSNAIHNLEVIGPTAEAFESILGIAQCDLNLNKPDRILLLTRFVEINEDAYDLHKQEAQRIFKLAAEQLSLRSDDSDSNTQNELPTWESIVAACA